MRLEELGSRASFVLRVSDSKRCELFENSFLIEAAFRIMAPLMDSRLRRWFTDPVEVLEAAGVRPGIDILEVGCGTGFFTIPAADMATEGHLHAIDLHPRAIKHVREKIQTTGVTNVSLTRNDALRTGMENEAFDLILLFGVLPSPVLPLDKLLPEMHRVLRPKGTMALWTALPLWSFSTVKKSNLFSYVERRKGVHIFHKKIITTKKGY